jgi:N-acetylmuramoyl-L-alanine amidase
MRARPIQMIGRRWLGLAGALGASLCVVAGATSYAQPTPAHQGVLAVRFGGDAHETRVVVEMDRTAKGRSETGDGPGRTVIVDLAKVEASSDLEGHGQGLVSAWAFDRTADGAKLTLQLTRNAHVVRRFLLSPADGVNVYRYVIDLSTDDIAKPAAASPAPGQAHAAELIAASVVTPLHLKKVIVIDAGHGGKDPGAKGADSREKDINLAAARALKAKLERTGHYRVVMTRDSDTFVPLETRVQIARRADADLFISLHSDSGPDPSVRGATVYTLSDKGSDRVVRGVMGQNDWFINVDLPGRDRAVNQILLDLTQRATRNRSAAFAEDVLNRIGDRVDLQRRNHRDAGFVVLLAPDVPAVLLEMGFITNNDDEAELNDAAKRDRLMSGVAESIDDYFGQQTRLASR